MKVSQEAIKKLFHDFEGLRLESYLCPANIWTIGWGCTRYEDGKKVQKGEKITKQRADELFMWHLDKFEKGVQRIVNTGLKQGQFDALVSFAYNLGLGQLKKSTLLKRVNANLHDEVPAQFMRWINANGKPLTGLKRRREMEVIFYKK